MSLQRSQLSLRCISTLLSAALLVASLAPLHAIELQPPVDATLWQSAFGGSPNLPGRLSLEIPEPAGESKPDPLAMADLATRLRQRHARDPNPANTHALGLYRLLTAGPGQAIPLLEKSLEMESTARAWSDLAVAYTIQAQNGQRDFDYVQALEAAHRATALAPEHPVSLYNLALAQENLHLRTVASKTWERFLDAAPGVADRQEVEKRLGQLARARPMDAWDEGVKEQILALASRGEVEPLRPFARSFAPSIRSLIQRELLVGWARLATAGDLAAAGSKLDQARHLARALADETSESLPAAAIAAIDQAARSDPASLEALVAGHAAFGDAFDLLRQKDFTKARKRFAEAEEVLSKGGGPFALWPRWFVGVCRYYDADFTGSKRDYAWLAERVDSKVSQTLAARTQRMLGLLAMTVGRPGGALPHYERGLEAVTSEAFREEAEGFHSLFAEAYGVLGDPVREWRYRLDSLEATWRVSSWERVQLALQGAINALLAQERPIAARYFTDELVQLAEATRDPVGQAETFVLQAEVLGALGDGTGSLESLRRAEEALGEIPNDELRSRIEAYMALIQADHLPSTETLGDLVRAETFYETSDYRFWLPRLRLLRARIHRSQGRTSHARADLERALQDLEDMRTSAPTGRLRLTFFETAQETFDELVALLWEEQAHDRAFEIAERGRARDLLDLALAGSKPYGVATAAGETAPIVGLDEALEELPDTVALLFFAEMGARLGAWRIWRGEVTHHALDAPPDLSQRIERLSRRLSAGDRFSDLETQLGELYDLLLRPLVSGVTRDTTLAIVPDRSLAHAPFAALYDREARRHLIERHPVVVAPSVTLFLQASEKAAAQQRMEKRTALIVADPEISRDVFDLPTLSAARRNASDLADFYETAESLTGPQATPEQVLEALPRHRIVHLGVHALLRPGAPLRSMLVLASSDEREDGVLYAHDLRALEGAETELVILAACRSRGEATGWRDFLVGLPRSFVAAGVPAVAATLWPVDDDASAELSLELHRHLARGADPATALHRAQIALLKDDRQHLTTWAAYTLVGGVAASRR